MLNLPYLGHGIGLRNPHYPVIVEETPPVAWFEAISEEPLVLLRVGCRVGAQDAKARLNIRGEAMPGDSQENKREPVVYRDGEYFE